MPTDITGQLSWFDRFASKADRFVSRAWFFAFCALLVGTVDSGDRHR
jgi:hypothetical protein